MVGQQLSNGSVETISLWTLVFDLQAHFAKLNASNLKIILIISLHKSITFVNQCQLYIKTDSFQINIYSILVNDMCIKIHWSFTTSDPPLIHLSSTLYVPIQFYFFFFTWVCWYNQWSIPTFNVPINPNVPTKPKISFWH